MADGGIYDFCMLFEGSDGGTALNQPILAIATSD
jgi:hypothetical protein